MLALVAVLLTGLAFALIGVSIMARGIGKGIGNVTLGKLAIQGSPGLVVACLGAVIILVGLWKVRDLGGVEAALDSEVAFEGVEGAEWYDDDSAEGDLDLDEVLPPDPPLESGSP